MLKRIKNSITPMLDTLGEALSHYFTLEGNAADELYSAIGEFIDKLNESVKQELPLAKDISEQIKDALKTRDLPETETHYNEYCNAVEAIPEQYKVVFLPYYDNTWDSLASVYRAFAADPLFVTEIVIIPIKRNTPTGWKMIYKDYLTEKGIPNTPYQDYDISADKPDFVFYNNPYDGVNIEKFQSWYLKQYAGCMVYVPYYLYIHAYIDNKEKFATSTKTITELPGHDNADIFVIQGNSFMKNFSQRSRNGKKMVVLGNPKTDNALEKIRSPLINPEWEKIIKDKTVFFLNTHYSMVINSAAGFFMPSLLKYINEHEDLALIWRPHPQSFLMLSENPQTECELVWMSYIKAAEESERIILDTTANSITAMTYCDAIISHYSSLLSEAVIVDKPIFVMAFDPRERSLGEKIETITHNQYLERLSKLREYNTKNLFYMNVMDHYDYKLDYLDNKSLVNFYKFISDIQNGVDDKKELRKLYREQLLTNLDGTCGEKIHEHIVKMINQQ